MSCKVLFPSFQAQPNRSSTLSRSVVKHMGFLLPQLLVRNALSVCVAEPKSRQVHPGDQGVLPQPSFSCRIEVLPKVNQAKLNSSQLASFQFTYREKNLCLTGDESQENQKPQPQHMHAKQGCHFERSGLLSHSPDLPGER